MFCPTCHSLLKPKMDGGKKKLACTSCNYTSTSANAAITETVKPSKEIEVLEERETRPLVDARCKKCNHLKAHHWSIQTRASDEPETRFFKCEKCKHTWREYK